MPTKLTQVPLLRPGETATVPVVHTTVPGTGSEPPTTQLTLDLERAPVPTRRYTADLVSVQAGPESVKLLFAQRRIVGDGIRSLVVVTLSHDAARWLLNSVERVLPTLRKFVTRNAISTPPALVLGSDEPPQTVVLSANIVAAAFVGREGCLDIYSASPFSFRDVQRRQSSQLSVEPLLRVDLTTGALLAMMETLEGLAANIPGEPEMTAER